MEGARPARLAIKEHGGGTPPLQEDHWGTPPAHLHAAVRPKAILFVKGRRLLQFRVSLDIVLDPQSRALLLQKGLDLRLGLGLLLVVAAAAKWEEVLERALGGIVIEIA